MRIISSRKIANLVSKQVSTPAIAREVYGYDTEPENRKFAGQAHQSLTVVSI